MDEIDLYPDSLESSLRSGDGRVEAIFKNLESCSSHDSEDSKQPKKFKVIFLGDSGVGKSSIMLRFCENRFNSNGVATFGLDISRNEVVIGNETILICLWDTGGQEVHDAITASYMRNADGVIMVYDVSNKKSFTALRRRWLDKIEVLQREEKVVLLLIGNKNDEVDKRAVDFTDGQRLATELHAEFFEMSAKTGLGADQAHSKLARLLLQNEINKLTKIMNGIDIENPNTQPTRKNSCRC